MTELDDAPVLERPSVVADGEPIDAAIDAAIETGALDLTEVAGAAELNWGDIQADVSRFATQCRMFSRIGDVHPCAQISEHYVPMHVLGSVDENADAETIRLATEERLRRFAEASLPVAMISIEEAKSSFKTELKKFIRARIAAFFGGGTPTEPGEGGFRGLKVTVNARTSGLAVVYCNSFFCRDEIPFGYTLTSPVVGYLRDAGTYYFGTLDHTVDKPLWSRLTYEIPPNFDIALHI